MSKQIDLGEATAYAIAKKHGYVGTEAQFAAEMTGAAQAAREAAQDASDAEAYAVGTRDGSDVPSTDPTYHNNAKYYAESLQVDATLTQQGKPADAKKVGDEITNLKGDLNDAFTIDVAIPFTDDGNGLIQYFDGNVQAIATYDHTNYIDVSGYNKISFKRPKSTAADPYTGMAFYTSGKVYISGVQCAKSQASIGYETELYSVDVPSNAKYARFSIYVDTATYGTFYVSGDASLKAEVERLAENSNPWFFVDEEGYMCQNVTEVI